MKLQAVKYHIAAFFDPCQPLTGDFWGKTGRCYPGWSKDFKRSLKTKPTSNVALWFPWVSWCTADKSDFNPRYHNWWLIGDITREPPFPLIQRPNLWKNYRMIYEKGSIACSLVEIEGGIVTSVMIHPLKKDTLFWLNHSNHPPTWNANKSLCYWWLPNTSLVICIYSVYDYFWWFWNDCPYLLYLYIYT